METNNNPGRMSLGIDRRKYPRLNVPLFCRTARPDEIRRRIIDASPGGVRVFSDERHRTGERLELELFFPDGTEKACSVSVVWCTPASGTGARYELGLEFQELSRDTFEILSGFLTDEF